MAYINANGEVCYDDIFNVSVVQTDAELLALATAQKADRDASDAKIAVKIAILKKLGLSEDEAQALLG